MIFTSGVKQIIHSVEKTQLWSGGLSPLGHKSHRHPHLDEARCGNARSDCAVKWGWSQEFNPQGILHMSFERCQKCKAHSLQSTPLCCSECAEFVLSLWERGNPEMYLPILKKPKFFAGRRHFFVCMSQGFALKAHPEDPPDALVTSSLCQVGRGLRALMPITSGWRGSQKHIQQLHGPVSCWKIRQEGLKLLFMHMGRLSEPAPHPPV